MAKPSFQDALVRALATADLQALGPLLTEEALAEYITQGDEGLQTRAAELTEAFGWLPFLAELDAETVAGWKVAQATKAQTSLDEEWKATWAKLPEVAQNQLDAGSFKLDFLKSRAVEVCSREDCKRPLEATIAAVPPGSPAQPPRPFVPLAEVQVNGRSTNTVAVYVLAAEGIVEARKTARARPSQLYQVLVADESSQAVLLGWGEMARILYSATHGKVGSRFSVTMVGCSARSAKAGMLEVLFGIGGKMQVIAADAAGCPSPEFTGLEHLADIADWGIVNIRGRLLETEVRNFKLVDDTGLCVRVHAEKQMTAAEGSRLELLMCTKSSRFSNVGLSSFSKVTEVASDDTSPLPSRVIFAL